MNNKPFAFISLPCKLALTGLLLLLSACASNTPHWDAHFGDAVRTSVAHQTLDPDAAQNTDPVNGVDGIAAKNTMERYQDSFKKPEEDTKVLTTIGIDSD